MYESAIPGGIGDLACILHCRLPSVSIRFPSPSGRRGCIQHPHQRVREYLASTVDHELDVLPLEASQRARPYSV